MSTSTPTQEARRASLKSIKKERMSKFHIRVLSELTDYINKFAKLPTAKELREYIGIYSQSTISARLFYLREARWIVAKPNPVRIKDGSVQCPTIMGLQVVGKQLEVF